MAATFLNAFSSIVGTVSPCITSADPSFFSAPLKAFFPIDVTLAGMTTLAKSAQVANEFCSSVVTDAGITMDVSPALRKAFCPTEVNVSGKSMLFRLEQPLNAYLPIVVTDGIVTLSRELQFVKTPLMLVVASGSSVTSSGSVMLFNAAHPLNAPRPIVLRLSGKLMVSKPAQPLKTSSLSAVTPSGTVTLVAVLSNWRSTAVELLNVPPSRLYARFSGTIVRVSIWS
nr:hypothetical protein [Lawsonibacter faecis]